VKPRHALVDDAIPAQRPLHVWRKIPFPGFSKMRGFSALGLAA
jgi:hypothetical protein